MCDNSIYVKCIMVLIVLKKKKIKIEKKNVGDLGLMYTSPWYQHTSIIIPLPRIHQHHFCFIESATDV